MEEKEWFAEWFDQPAYHVLYQDRDAGEARHFIDSLLDVIPLSKGARVLDLACGKGRHALYLADKGFDVTGIDLSEASIAAARVHEREGLAFYQADMRNLFRINYFDAVFNFFTSFGYFDSDREHARALKHSALNLRPGGFFVLDYLNVSYAEAQLIPRETKRIGDVDFRISRSFEQGYFYKTITVQQGDIQRRYVEKVRGFTLDDFKWLFQGADLEISRVYGNYALEPFDSERSERLILVATRKAPIL